jgi:tRNA U38,U39,U40 pseudouridine synthase TruA
MASITDEQDIPDPRRRCVGKLAACRPDGFHHADGFHRTVYLDIEANAFLYRMVRSIVGTTLQVGMGKLSLAQFASLFAAADRSLAGPTASPHGLCLMAVNY